MYQEYGREQGDFSDKYALMIGAGAVGNFVGLGLALAGVGRIDMIEDRLVGIKSREIYEAPAATILIEAHKALEYLTLDRNTLKFKAGVAIEYARLIYDGLWYTPLKHSLDAFIDKTQEKVSGTIKVKLHKGHAIVVGRKSENSLYKEELATYSEGDEFDQSLAKGFIELFGLPYRDSMK